MAQVGYAGVDKRGRNSSGPSINGNSYASYHKIAKTINSVGISNLRRYATEKKRPVRNFDRDIRVVEYVLKYGPDYAGRKFDISSAQAGDILRKYYRYALECREELESW